MLRSIQRQCCLFYDADRWDLPITHNRPLCINSERDGVELKELFSNPAPPSTSFPCLPWCSRSVTRKDHQAANRGV